MLRLRQTHICLDSDLIIKGPWKFVTFVIFCVFLILRLLNTLSKMEWFGIAVITLIAALTIREIYHDYKAKKAVTRFCHEHGVELIEAKIYKNAYGVYFRKNGKRCHARFQYRKGKIEWEKNSPIE